MSSFVKRLISSISALIVLGVILYLKGIVLDIAVLIIAGIASYEYVKAFKQKDFLPSLNTILGMVVSFLILVSGLSRFCLNEKFGLLIIYASILLLYILISLFVTLARKMNPIDMMINVLSVFYIAFPLGMILALSKLDNGFSFIYLVFIISFSSDSLAYVTGRTFGKHKLAPKFSPNKTKEGSLGAIVGTTVVLLILKLTNVYHYSFVAVVILGVFGSILGQIGDLTASIIKRYTGIKDFGNVMPGHGGILDRLDSIIFVTPLVFIYYLLLTYQIIPQNF